MGFSQFSHSYLIVPFCKECLPNLHLRTSPLIMTDHRRGTLWNKITSLVIQQFLINYTILHDIFGECTLTHFTIYYDRPPQENIMQWKKISHNLTIVAMLQEILDEYTLTPYEIFFMTDHRKKTSCNENRSLTIYQFLFNYMYTFVPEWWGADLIFKNFSRNRTQM